jgi:hypothetical protein
LSVFGAFSSPRTAAGFASATRPTCGRRIAAIASALPVASSATWSSAAKLAANNRSDSGVVSTLPAERIPSSSAIATSQKSR